MITARIVADSISSEGVRITTMALCYPRIIHSEMLRHRLFARCARSSRAVPVSSMLREARRTPFVPSEWRMNQRGMQGYKQAGRLRRAFGEFVWRAASYAAVVCAWTISRLGVHKQIANRLLEPFLYTHEVVTATDKYCIGLSTDGELKFINPWEEFFRLRCAPDAEPHIQILANIMRRLYEQSIPHIRKEHMPFSEGAFGATGYVAKVSAMRCARTSYYAPGATKMNPADDARRAEDLLSAGHMSPFEHPAKAREGEQIGPFYGWIGFRHWK